MDIGNDVSALLNTSVTIRCQASGVPQPTITWYKNGQELLLNERLSVDEEDSLTITETRSEDSDRYTCAAENTAGQANAFTDVAIVGRFIFWYLVVFLLTNKDIFIV